MNSGLKKHELSVRTVIFMIFCLVAAGCYGIEDMISSSGPGLTIIMLIVLAFLWGLPFGLVVSELGSLRPQEGGYYKWVQEALGEFWGFQAGWWRTISIYIDNTLYVILAANYLGRYFHLSEFETFFIKFCIILVFVIINLIGIKEVGVLSSIFSILIVLAFTLVAIVGFLNFNLNPLEPFIPTGVANATFKDWTLYIGSGIAIGMWMYSGYESMSTIAGEIKDPQVIPKATLLTVPLVALTYILPTIAGLGSIGDWQSWGVGMDSIGYSTVVTEFLSESFGLFFVIVAFLANCSIYNTYITSGSRGFFVLAEDNLAPKFLVKCNNKTGVPYVSVLIIGILNLILCNLDFKIILVVDVFLLASSYILVYISAIIIRRKTAVDQYKFKIPGGTKLLSLICIIPISIAFISFFINGTDYFVGGMLGLLTGPAMYVIWKLKYGGLHLTDKVKYPLDKKTKLAKGDISRMGFLSLGIGIIGILGHFWLSWFESGSKSYYLQEYSSGLGKFLFSDFDKMIAAILVIGILAAIMGFILIIYDRKKGN